MNLFNFFFPKILEQTSSKYNKKIQIVELFGRRSLRVNGMTQSGSIVEDIYKKIIPLLDCHSRVYPVRKSGNLYKFMDPRVKPEDDSVIKVLILGFGTGTFAKLIQQKYSQAKIISIEIDKTIIDLGKKYFETDKITNLKIINNDAIKWINRHSGERSDSRIHSSSSGQVRFWTSQNDDKSNKFDIIFVDLYRGEQIETKVETSEFLEKARELLDKNGVIIFNRLNFSAHKEKAQKFKASLDIVFSRVTQLKSYSNIIFLCKK